ERTAKAIRGHFTRLVPCPLYPQKQTLDGGVGMSARPRTQFRFKYLAVRIRLLRLGGSLTTFSTVSAKSRHSARLQLTFKEHRVLRRKTPKLIRRGEVQRN